MKELFERMIAQLEKGEPLVLVTVTAASGATPRGAGARMLVGREGRLAGTIGGGAVEFRSEQIAAEVLRDHSSRGHDFCLSRSDVQDLGMICGGSCSVFFTYIPAWDAEVLALAEKVEQGFRKDAGLWLICDLKHGGRLGLYSGEEGFFHVEDGEFLLPHLKKRSTRITEDGRDFYVEKILDAGRVLIFGGGHLARELVPVLSRVGFRCTVMDDRPEFAKPEFFPGAEQVICGDFGRISDYIQVTEADYVCVMTRGHAGDTLVQAQVLPRHPYYLGVIGSRQKAAAVRRRLKEEFGIPDEQLDRVTTPIGLDIGSETPAEIAVSIAAQLIQARSLLSQ